VGKLLAAIIGFRLRGEDFDNHRGIEQGISMLVLKKDLTTDRDEIRVRLEPRRADSDAHIAGVGLARAPPKLLAHFTEDITGDQAV